MHTHKNKKKPLQTLYPLTVKYNSFFSQKRFSYHCEIKSKHTQTQNVPENVLILVLNKYKNLFSLMEVINAIFLFRQFLMLFYRI